MSTVRRIACLANSRKMSGRCIAGKDVSSNNVGPWIRPICDRPSHEISEEERQYHDGSLAQLGDIIDIPIQKASPNSYQSENQIIDAEYYWEKVGSISWNDLPKFLDTPATLWVNGHHSGNGLNDRVPDSILPETTSSLYFVRLDKVILEVSAPGAAFGNPKRKVRAAFEFMNIRYDLTVTDPTISREMLAKANGNYPINESCYGCISLGELFNGYAYKLVASLLTQSRFN